VAAFEPGRALELEPNPHYWRAGLPRCDALGFQFGVPAEEILDGFRRGRFSLAWDLHPADVEALRRDTALGARYVETPRLSTYYVALNAHRGPLADEGLRRTLAAALAAPKLVRQTVGRLAVPAHRFLPPGLLGLGAEPGRLLDSSGARSSGRARGGASGVAIDAMLNSVYETSYGELLRAILAALDGAGFEVRIVEGKSEYASNQAELLATADLVLTRWIADYPDASNFMSLLHTETGLVGRLCGTPEIDRLIERGRREADPTLRADAYREIERLLAARTLLVPLFHEQTYCFARPELQDLALNFFQPIVAYERLWVRR
jgi:ABC-type oligopeptide transport system substrate-binding subunit